MKIAIAGLGAAIAALTVSLPAQAQLADQEYCDLTAFEGDTLVALNSGWCHETDRPFITTYFYDEFDEQVYVVFGVRHEDDPAGHSRVGIFRLPETPGNPLVEIVTATFDTERYVTEYHAGNAETAPLFHHQFMSALEEIEGWRPR